MQGCISTFRKFLILFVVVTAWALPVWAAEGKAKNAADDPMGGAGDEIISGPFSEYGEFDSSEDEAADERFFQFGRFFGVGLGFGSTIATGNAGLLYQGGFPTVDFRIDYWFDFQFALQFDIANSKHNYDVQPDGLTDVNLFRTLIQVKYYLDTRDLSAPITFVSPHLIAGGGFYRRTDNVTGTDATIANTTETVNAFGFNAGVGLELTLKPKKTYLQFEGIMHFVQFSDQFDQKFARSGIPDKTGAWISAGVSILWTW